MKIKKINIVQNEDVYDITVNKNNNFFANNILVHNCGEIPLCELDSCRLMVINLYSYVKNPFTPSSYFDYDLYQNNVKIAQRLMDNMIDLEIESLNRIINKIKSDPEPDALKQNEIDLWNKMILKAEQGRRTGLGITALGDTLAALGIKYDSNEGISEVEKIYYHLKHSSYRSSIDMAKEIGPFPIWDKELEKDNKFLLRIKEEDPNLYDEMQKYGRRNIALNTTAPVGTISMLAGTTSGIEPLFMMSYIRRKKINDGDTSVTKVDFIDQNGVKWQEFKVYHPKLKEWMKITNNENENENESPWFGSCAEDLDWKQRVKMQAAAQKHLDHSISSCVTKDTLIETNKGLYYIDELFDFSQIEPGEFFQNDITDLKIKNHNKEFVPITAFYNNGAKEIWKTVLHNNLEIRTTNNERVIVLDEDTGIEEWKRVDELEIGDLVKI